MKKSEGGGKKTKWNSLWPPFFPVVQHQHVGTNRENDYQPTTCVCWWFFVRLQVSYVKNGVI